MFVLQEGVEFQLIDDNEGMIVDANKGRYYELNNVSTIIIEEILGDSKANIDQIIGRLEEKIDADYNTLENAIKKIKDKLLALELVITTHS